MRRYLFRIFVLLALSAGYGQLKITFNYDMIEGLQAIQEAKTIREVQFDSLIFATGTAGFLRKMQSYRQEATRAAFKQSLGHLLDETPETDVFFYGRVKHKFKTGTAFVTNVKKGEAQIINELVDRIRYFWPSTDQREITVYFVFGAIGGGWTMDGEPDAFYVDVSSFEENDAIGLQYLCTHEILHLLQDQTRPKLTQNEPTAYYLEQAFREGMATYIADFSTIENASGYALFNQKIYRKNQRRMETNYRLFEVLVIDLFAGRCEYGFVDNLTLSGMYDSPAYFVFYDMIRTMEEALGRNEVYKRFELGAVPFIRAYQRLPKTDHRFSDRLDKVLDQLD